MKEPGSRFSRKETIAAVVFLVFSFAAVALLSKYSPYIDILESKSYDFMMSVVRGPLPAPDDVMIVAIDDSSLQEFADSYGFQFPWPRQVYGELIRILNEGGARGVAFDVIFDLPSVEENDAAMAASIRNSKIPVILGATQGVVEDPRFTRITEIPPLPLFTEAGAWKGFATLNPDQDSVLRRARLSVDGERTLATQMLKVARGEAPVKQSAVIGYEGDDPQILINYAGPRRTIPTVSFSQAIDYQKSLPPGVFKNKLVFVGRSLDVQDISGAKTQADLFASPFDLLTPGVEIHANVLNTMLREVYISRSSLLEAWLIVIFPGVMMTLIVLSIKTFRLKILVALGMVFGWAAAAQVFFLYLHHWVYTVQPLFMTLSVFGLNTLYQYRATEKERAHIRRALQGYVSKQVMNEVLKNTGNLELGGVTVTATVLFSDIAGFSKISEKITARELATMLNGYFTKMGDEIMKREGMINKYIGDAIMAIWGAPLPNPDHAAQACRSALAMKKIVDTMAPMRARIGLNTGPMVAGNLGHAERMEYTVIGDAVNLASRLEGANKGFGTAIMISEFTEELVHGRFLLRLLDQIRVVGKQQPIRVYELLAENGDPEAERLAPMVESFNSVLACYDSRDWTKACQELEQHLQKFPEDTAAQAYLKRCHKFCEQPPPPEWDGVYTMESK